MSGITVGHSDQPIKLYTLNHQGYAKTLMDLFHERAQMEVEAPFRIAEYSCNDALGQWSIKLLFESGESQELQISYQDLEDEVNLEKSRQVQRAFTESTGINVPAYEDGFTKAATHFFETKKIKESKLLGSPTSRKNRIVVKDGLIHITKGLSKLETLFLRIEALCQSIFNWGGRFARTYNILKWEEQNRESIDTYVSFLKKEIGPGKLDQIQKIYRFDFAEMRKKGLPLEPKHIYFCNIGMNNIEMDDVTHLGQRICQFFNIYKNDVKLIPILKGNNHPFTNREVRALLKKFGEETTVADLHIALGGILGQPYPSEHFSEKTFGKLLSLLETPDSAWDKIYTGRKFHSPIKGAYNKEVTDRSTFRPWVDQQELLQVFQEIKDPFPGKEVDRKKVNHYFYEMLCKVVVKKHLMRSLTPNDWRVGALIPSPYKNEAGETVYYRVDQGVDSGHGKLWYVFRPACDDYDHSFPVIRVPRDTSPDRYAQRGGPTLTRDLAMHAGAHFSSTTLKEDKAFFREFTLPIWMGHLALAMRAVRATKTYDEVDNFVPHIKNVHVALNSEIRKRIFEGRINKEEGEVALEKLNECLNLIKSSEGLEKLKKMKLYLATIVGLAPFEMDDYIRMEGLIEGKQPRPMASVGNSLGGFDAQYDLFRQTYAENRVPISNIDLYTHSTLKIDLDDDNRFRGYILQNKDLLLDLGVHLSIQHVTEFNDKVSMATHGTFLGRGLQIAAEQDEQRDTKFPVDVSLKVFRPNPFSTSPQIQQLKTHIRRIEHLEEGKDYHTLSKYRLIHVYDEYGRNFRFKGRTLEKWRKKGIWLGLAEKSELIWRSWRYFFGLAHPIPKENINDKLVVVYNKEGEQQAAFHPTRLTPDLDKLFFRVIPVEVTF